VTGPRESALLVEVPEAEPLVGALRSVHDPSAAAGVPAHITILYPFVPPERIDDGVEDAVRSVVAGHRPFTFSLRAAEWFDDVYLYLAPSPPEPFLALIEALAHRFPEYPPYGGEIEIGVIVPHVTVAIQGSLEMHGALSSELPIHAVTTEVLLMEQDDGGMWSVRERFPLGGGG
jgi:2'-5' RNA ligase